MSVYSAKGTQAAAAKTALVLIATATIRPRIQRITGKNVGTVTLDSQIEVLCSRITTTGTTTPVVLAGTDPNDLGATLLAGSNATVEPTYTPNSLEASLIFNPRGRDEWQAYDRAAEIVLPGLVSNGLGALVNNLGGATTVVIEAFVQQ